MTSTAPTADDGIETPRSTASGYSSVSRPAPSKTLNLTTAQYSNPRLPSEHIGVDVDVLENCTAALSSLAAMCDDNAKRVGECGGIDLMLALTTSTSEPGRVCWHLLSRH